MVSAAPTLDRAAVSTPAPAKAAPKKARWWWHVHQWAGLKFSIFLSFIIFTGTLAVVSYEIDWLMRPAMRVAPSTVSGEVAWTAIARNVAAAHPDYQIRSIQQPIASAFAASVTVERPDGELAFVYAHPTTGAVQGEGGWVGAQRVLRNMHRHLNLPTRIGVPIVSSLAFLLLVTLVTSLIVYKKWWRGFLKPIRRRDARTAWGDFHRLSGVWTLWFVALMVVTGIWYFVESLGGDAPLHPEPVAIGTPAKGIAWADTLPASLAAARAADPALRIVEVQFPSDEDFRFKFEGQKSAILVRHRSNAVWTDAGTAQVLMTTDGRNLSVHQRISEAADPLHFGNFGGYWTKMPWFLFGLLLTGLSVSGMALYGTRLVKAAKGAELSVTRGAWQGMGLWRWPALAAVATGFYYLPDLWA